MKPNKLIELMMVGIILPTTAMATSVSAHEVKVNTGNVEAITRSDGSTYINSGGTIVNVPSSRSYRSWNPFRYWSLPWQSYKNNNRTQTNCRQSSYQSTNTTPSGKIVQSSSSRHSCN